MTKRTLKLLLILVVLPHKVLDSQEVADDPDEPFLGLDLCRLKLIEQ